MNDLYETIKRRQQEKEKELADKQQQFLVMCENEIQSKTFEKNAIFDLVTMQQLKSEIGELKHMEILLRQKKTEM